MSQRGDEKILNSIDFHTQWAANRGGSLLKEPALDLTEDFGQNKSEESLTAEHKPGMGTANRYIRMMGMTDTQVVVGLSISFSLSLSNQIPHCISMPRSLYIDVMESEELESSKQRSRTLSTEYFN